MQARFKIGASVLLAAVCFACEAAAPRTNAVDCVSSENCAEDFACFFGKCTDPGYNITEVYLDITPANGTNLLRQVDEESPRDLGAGLKHDVALTSPKLVTGMVATATKEPRAGSVVVSRILEINEPRLPGLTSEITAPNGAEGFALTLNPGSFTVRFQPLDKAARPPIDFEMALSTQDDNYEFEYPTDSDLVRVSGRVVNSVTDPNGKADVKVSGVALVELKQTSSTETTTDPQGNYEIAFLPQAHTHRLRVTPTATNPYVPTVEGPIVWAEGSEGPPLAADFALGVAPGVKPVETRVVDASANPISQARIEFIGGSIGAGTYTNVAISGADGLAVSNLLPGIYEAYVSPPPESAAALTQSALCISADDGSDCLETGVAGYDALDGFEVALISKITLTGNLTNADGYPVAEARLALRRRGGPVQREFSTTSQSDGSYELLIDPGTDETPVEYELTIDPKQSAGAPDPRHRQIVVIDSRQDQRVDVALYASSIVFGRTVDSRGSAVANARIELYSVELGSTESPLLVGLGQSNSEGEYAIPVPVPSQ